MSNLEVRRIEQDVSRLEERKRTHSHLHNCFNAVFGPNLCDVSRVEAVVVRVLAVAVLHGEHEAHEGRRRDLEGVE